MTHADTHHVNGGGDVDMNMGAAGAEEGEWEVSAKKVKSKQRAPKPHKRDGPPAGAININSTGPGQMSHLILPSGELVTLWGEVCRPYLKGECTVGKACDKLHPPGKVGCRVACAFYLTDRCTRGKACR